MDKYPPELAYIMGMTPEGRKILQNPDGSVATEESIGRSHPLLNGGQWTNFPTIWNGERLQPGQALTRAIMEPQQRPSFSSQNAADEAAVKRTQELDVLMKRMQGIYK